MIYFDIDRFKPVNDQHGHAIGDALLIVFASRLKGVIRPSDFAARLAGDEFAIIADISDGGITTKDLVQRIRSITNEEFVLDGISVCVGVSVGYAHFPSDSDVIDTLLKIADTKMYTDKSRCRDNTRANMEITEGIDSLPHRHTA